MPPPTLGALRQTVAVVVPSRLAEFFPYIQDAFGQAGDQDSVLASGTSISGGSHDRD